MKYIVATFYFLAVFCASAQTLISPIPKYIIVCSTNRLAPVTVIKIDTMGFQENYLTQRTVATNLETTCMSAQSVSVTINWPGPDVNGGYGPYSNGLPKETAFLVLQDVSVYGPKITDGLYGHDLKLQSKNIQTLHLPIYPTGMVQINGELLTAGDFSKKFRNLPD